MHFSSLVSLLPLLGLGAARPHTAAAPYPVKRQSNESDYQLKTPPLDTPWTADVGTNPWPEYPRPLLEREQWKNLNGVWRYQKAENLEAVDSPPFGQRLPQAALVPSCLESGLSGIQAAPGDAIYNWLSTSFDVPSNWTGDRVLLNFGAVDYEATVFVNGQEAGFHRGGYWEFTLDITDHISGNGTNELLVFVYDPTDSEGVVVPIGKQTLEPSHIFYTPCSGIWQTVWLESVPDNYINDVFINGDMEGQLTVNANSAAPAPIKIEVIDPESGDVVATGEGTSGEDTTFSVDNVKLWSPDSPNLYDLSITLGDDTVKSYTGFRTFARGEVDGVQRPLVNGEFIFKFGTLDQGYWPDGLHTPPTVEAMRYDLEVLKKLNFNMVRKHIKTEPPLFYRACDELGLLVTQDMPSLPPDAEPNAEQQTEFERQFEIFINQHRSYPSISTWVIYNEGWGQPDNPPFADVYLTDRLQELDPTGRLVDSVSGWNDHGAGDFHDNHHYANPQCGTPFYSIASTPYDPSRIGFQGEFGGIGHNVSIENLWNVQAAIDTINQTYEINQDLDAWAYRAHRLLGELRDQVDLYSCSGGVWTQTTDVEGEVNGLLTYDRRILRADEQAWKDDIQALYDAAAGRGGGAYPSE